MRTPSYQFKQILFNRLHESAVPPAPATEGDVGFDLYGLADVELPVGKITVISTGIALAQSPEPLLIDGRVVAIPYPKIEGRSGLASKGIFPVGGIVDPTYRGEIKVLLFNSTSDSYTIPKAKAVAQLVLYYTLSNSPPHHIVKFLETNSVDRTDRGTSGFGSSDKV
jgi:dUTP pyrophosphatase